MVYIPKDILPIRNNFPNGILSRIDISNVTVDNKRIKEFERKLNKKSKSKRRIVESVGNTVVFTTNETLPNSRLYHIAIHEIDQNGDSIKVVDDKRTTNILEAILYQDVTINYYKEMNGGNHDSVNRKI